MSDAPPKLNRGLFLDMSCPCGDKFSLEYTAGNQTLKELVDLALRWIVQHRHADERSGPSEHNRPEPI